MSGCKGFNNSCSHLIVDIIEFLFELFTYSYCKSEVKNGNFFSTDIHHHRDHYKCKISKGLVAERVEGCMFALPFYKII